MEQFRPLSGFFEAIKSDGRICISHIGLYATLVQYWQEHHFVNPFQAFSYEVTGMAKISANTYHKCIRDLHDFGYINYEPSFKRNQRSKVQLLYLAE
ncbi:hypothetical protein [Mucilaginibacter sp. L3T2-6]|uniref:hypothetical protein n=1 Tax=Mucilaginibacter sp. L3T2-6 TaxID=3062491 RepID=UPI0026755F8D|nr:hypothetical protein [Mucilaginibacter sp. L3T2-6]MDO3641231.1 hypothetical protein [Mucilaginibacter sp. L3T2-6]MDV6214010.1 hypothetical protein [Mucilaginibacter sp. L3T2-6]